MEKVKSKYIGKVYDGMWEVIDLRKTDKTNIHYVLENIYNHNQCEITGEAMRNLDRGKTTMSSIIHQCIRTKQDNRVKFRSKA